MATELGIGYVSLRPSMAGFSAAASKELKAGIQGPAGVASKAVGGIESSMKSVGSRMTGTLTPAAAALGLGLKKSFDEWDAGFDTIRAGTGATGALLDGLGASMKTVGGQVTQPLSEVGAVIAELNKRTGATGKGLEGMATQVLHLSRVTGTDAKTNVAAITRVFGDWNIATEDQAGTMDKLFRASQNTGIGIDLLAQSVVQFGAPMRELGFSFGETSALLGKFEKEGVNAELVMGGLKQGLGRLAKAGKNPREELFGLMENIENAGLTAENRTKVFEIFGARAGIDMAKAIEEGRFALGDLVTKVESGSDTIAKAGADTIDYGDKIKMFSNKVMASLGPVGEIGAFAAGGVASMGPAILGVSAISPKLGFVGSAVTKLGQTFGITGKLAQVLFAGGIGLAIAAVVIAAILVIKHWDKVKAFLVASWNFIKRTAISVWNGIKDFFVRWWPLILGIFTGGLGLVIGLIVKNWDKIKNTTGKAWDWIKDRVRGAVDFITSMPGKIGDAFSKLGEWLVSPFKRAFRAIASFWNRTIGKVSFKTPGWLGPLGNKGFSMPKMPTLGKGGEIVRSGLSIVGELGPELVELERGARVHPLPLSAAASSSRSMQSAARITIDLTGGDDELVKWLRKRIRVEGGDVQEVLGKRS